MAPLEPWEKAIVDIEKFSATTHGKPACTDCHAGQQSAEKDVAHTGLIASPSQDAAKACGICHVEVTTAYADSLHNTQAGYWTALETRSVPENHPALEEMFGNHCATCHTTCGECHVSQPKNVGGGLFSGHVFERTPPMTRSCTACHGSRVGNEFLGKNEGFPGDVHFREARMNCIKCHPGTDLHNQTQTTGADAPDHRYSGAEMPACTNCHPEVVQDEILMHQMHSDDLSCNVCHSITYTSCDSCHVAISEKTGNPFFETSATYPTFKIGVNPRQSEERPYNFVLVRHIPIDPQSFAYYGENLLPNFILLSTWQYTTPHNIQLRTPQNASCDACHGNQDLFLTADQVKPEELEANASVIVTSLPPSPEFFTSANRLPADHATLVVCLQCHATGLANATLPPENHTGWPESSCKVCHKLP